MITLIVPAHNEAAVIERCLRAWVEAIRSGEVEVIVVANGCTDDTAARARAVNPRVRIVETDVPSKSNALNLGDAAADETADGTAGWVRVYADADVVLTLEALRRLVAPLRDGRALAAAPTPALNLSKSSWFVRAYYDVDTRLPWFQEGIGNAGVYAMSAAGRARFEKFPNITTDDSFVRVHFSPDERMTVPDAQATVTAPATLRSLVAIKTRSHYSKFELNAVCPELVKNSGEPNEPALKKLALNPINWPALAVYMYVKLAARARCRMKYRTGSVAWERDDSSRPAGAAQPSQRGERETSAGQNALMSSNIPAHPATAGAPTGVR